jgi:DNA-binding NarL/FixJ family response regulator
MIRLFLVDDHPVVREGIRASLAHAPDLLVVGEASHGQALLDQLPATPADVVVLDINMPVLGGLATTQRLRAEFPEVKIVVLSMLNHERYVGQLFEAGALGYILKNNEPAEIVLAIHTVATGQPYLCSELGLQLLQRASLQAQRPATPPPESPAPNPYNFSPRELSILELLAEGLTNADIATRLQTSKRTIETQRQHLLDKTKSKNVASLIRLAVSEGMLR